MHTIISTGGHMKRDILTKRENEIFQLLIQNYTTSEISIELGICEKTVRNHISNVIQKLGVESRTSALLELIKMDVLKL